MCYMLTSVQKVLGTVSLRPHTEKPTLTDQLRQAGTLSLQNTDGGALVVKFQ